MYIVYDLKEMEAQCKNIVHDISEKFIDLGLDEGDHSVYGAYMLQKQEKFKKDFERFNF